MMSPAFDLVTGPDGRSDHGRLLGKNDEFDLHLVARILRVRIPTGCRIRPCQIVSRDIAPS